MAKVIDEEGNLFGVINIVDALVILLVGAVLVAGVSLVAFDGPDQPDRPDRQTLTVEYQSSHLQPYVVAAITEGRVSAGNVTRVDDKTVSPSKTVTQDQFGNLSVKDHPIQKTVTLHLTLNVTAENGDYLYNGTPIEIGTDLTLDFGKTTVSGQIIAVEEPN